MCDADLRYILESTVNFLSNATSDFCNILINGNDLRQEIRIFFWDRLKTDTENNNVFKWQ